MLSSTYSYKSTSRLAKQPRKLGRFSCKLIKAREVCASLEPSNRRKFKLTSTGSKDKEAKATLIIHNFVKVKARTRSSQLVAIVALISLKLVTLSSKSSSRQKKKLTQGDELFLDATRQKSCLSYIWFGSSCLSYFPPNRRTNAYVHHCRSFVSE